MSTFKDNTWICKDNFWISSAENPAMTKELRQHCTAKLDETRQLKGHFSDYLTEIDVSSPCEVLPPDYQNHLDRKYVQKGGIDVYAFREWCRELDADQEWIDKTERELF